LRSVANRKELCSKYGTTLTGLPDLRTGDVCRHSRSGRLLIINADQTETLTKDMVNATILTQVIGAGTAAIEDATTHPGCFKPGDRGNFLRKYLRVLPHALIIEDATD